MFFTMQDIRRGEERATAQIGTLETQARQREARLAQMQDVVRLMTEPETKQVTFGKGPQGRRSAVEPTDWHDIEEHHFARKVAAAMEQAVRAGKVKALIVVAPPRTLADLRNALHADVKACVIAEINKDLTKHPVWDIEKHLTAET